MEGQSGHLHSQPNLPLQISVLFCNQLHAMSKSSSPSVLASLMLRCFSVHTRKLAVGLLLSGLPARVKLDYKPCTFPV